MTFLLIYIKIKRVFNIFLFKMNLFKIEKNKQLSVGQIS